nr:hypothetical protein [Tanacetum cinerariifolium]
MSYFLLDLPLRDDSLLSLYIRCSTDESILLPKTPAKNSHHILLPNTLLQKIPPNTPFKKFLFTIKADIIITITNISHTLLPSQPQIYHNVIMKMVSYEAFACPCGSAVVVLRESYKPKTRGSSSTLIFSPGSLTPSRYSQGASTPQSYSSRSSRNAECSNCKHLLDKTTVLEATVEVYMYSEQHIVNSAALLHEVYNDMEKLDLESGSKVVIDVNNPLYLHSNDTNGTPLIRLKLTRTENYRVWAAALKHCIHSKNKLRFLTGSCVKPDPEVDPFLAEQWESNAKLMWGELAKTYDKIDGFVIFNLHYKINIVSQNGSKLSDYYHMLNSLWREYDPMVQLLVCTCDSASSFKDHYQLLKLVQFVMGLDDIYAPIRSTLLTTNPLPTIKEVFSLLSRDESHRNIHSGGSEVKSGSSAFVSKVDNKESVSFAAKSTDNKKRSNVPYDDMGDNSEGGGINPSSIGSAVETVDAVQNPTADPSASTSKESFDNSGSENITNVNSDKLGSINAQGPIDDGGATPEYHINISGGEDLNIYDLDNVLQTSEGSLDHSSVVGLRLIESQVESQLCQSYKEAAFDPRWIDAMNSEMEALIRNMTWVITKLPSGRKPIRSKWIFKVKYKSTGKVERFKARLVAKGYNQKEGINYAETFSPVVKMVTVSITEINKCKQLLNSKFLIKDLGNLKYFLGIEVLSDNNKLCLCQRKYCLELLNEFGMLAAKPSKVPLYVGKSNNPVKLVEGDYKLLDNISNYQKLIGKLIYLTITRPDIAYVVHKLSQVMHAPKQSDIKLAFKVLRYLKGSPRKGVSYFKSNFSSISAYVDSDWAKCTATRRTEFRAMSNVTCVVMWVLKILTELRMSYCTPVSVYCDSSVVIQIAANHVFHEKTKNFEIDMFFLREKIADGVIKICKVKTDENVAAILTKVQDYALWDVIENGNSFKPVPRTIANADAMQLLYSFLVNQPNGSQLVHEDLEQIRKDDLEEMYLKWQLALLSMRARRYFQRTGKKITINGSDTAGYDKTKVECFNCHKMGNFARECRSPRNQESRTKNQDNSRKTVIMEDTSSKAMVAIDGASFDWSYMADDGGPTNMALMAFSYLEAFSSVVTRPGIVEVEVPSAFAVVLGTADESQVLLKVPKKNNMYSFDMKNIVPQKDLTCLLAEATNDESMLWHRRLGHINFKNINKLVKDNLVRGLPLKRFANDQNYVACLKGKQQKVSFKFTWVFFLATKDETSRILKSFIIEIENLVEKKVKIIRCDNGTKFKHRVMNEFYEEKGIKREYSVARTPQQNRVTERRNKTLNQLGKFDGKSDDEIFVGYSTTSKAFRVYNIRTRKVEENLPISFLENIAGKRASFDVDQLSMETGSSQDYILMPLCKDTSLFDSSSQASDSHNKYKHGPSRAGKSNNQERPNTESNTKTVNTAGPVNTATPTYVEYLNDPLMYDLEDVGIFDDAYDDRDEGVEADYNNLETMEPKKVTHALDDESWVEDMHEELLQFKLLNVWTLVNLPPGKRAIGTKWVYRKKKDQKGIVFRNKAKLDSRLSREKMAYFSVKINRLISWQCKKQTIVANSTTKAEYVDASNCCGQVLWLQNQLLDYGYNFMQTNIHVDNERLELKGYLINDGYADLVQHTGVYFNTAGVFLLGFHQHNKWSSIHHV